MGSWQYNLTVASAVACGAAVVALFVARRGRRVDDHPLCRKCGFDLFGLPGTSHNCPECGRDLRRRRATRVGHRRRFRKVGLLALVVFLAAGGWLGFVGVATARGVNWNQYKSVSWLLREAGAPGTRDAALAELAGRLGDDKLDQAAVTRVVEAALAHQADRRQAWFPKWGALVEFAHARSKVPEALWQRYLTQAVDCFALEVRPEIREGQYLPFRISQPQPMRVALVRLYDMDLVRPVIALDGQVLRVVMKSGSLDAKKGPFEGLAVLPPAGVLRLAAGEHQVTVTVDCPLEPFRLSSTKPSVPLRVQQARMARSIQFRTGPASGVTMRFEDGLVEPVRAALGSRVRADLAAGTLVVELSASRAPVDLAFTAVLQEGALWRDLGYVVFPAKGGSAKITLNDVLPTWQPEKVEIVLTPSLDAAETTLDMKTIWGGQVFLSDVPVEWAAPAKKR